MQHAFCVNRIFLSLFSVFRSSVFALENVQYILEIGSLNEYLQLVNRLKLFYARIELERL